MEKRSHRLKREKSKKIKKIIAVTLTSLFLTNLAQNIVFAAGIYTDISKIQMLKSPNEYIYSKEVILNFDGNGLLDGVPVTSGTKVTAPGVHTVQVDDGSQISYGNFSIVNNTNGRDVVDIAAGTSVQVADNEGNLYSWGGYNGYGLLGDGSTIAKNVPVKINGYGAIGVDTKIVGVTGYDMHTGAIDSEGNLYTWGDNAAGEIGDGTINDRPAPVKVNGHGAIGIDTKIVSADFGGIFSSAIDSEGNLYTWGNNNYGQLGNGTDGTTTNKRAPIKVNGHGAIGIDTKIVAASAGVNNILAIDSEGNLYSWGGNEYGQLGIGTSGTTANKTVPVKINGKGAIGIDTKIVSVSIGRVYSSAIDSEGNLYTWGSNNYGQLGDGTKIDKKTPVKINGKGAIGIDTKIISVDLGANRGSAIDSEGSLYTWGRNNYGQLGDGTKIDKNAPVKINGSGAIETTTKIVSVDMDHEYSNYGSSIDSEGNLYTWGRNNHGQLGNGTNTDSLVPVESILTMDYDDVSAITDAGNSYIDVKVKNPSTSTQIAYKAEGENTYTYADLQPSGDVKISVPLVDSAKVFEIRLASQNNLVNNVNDVVSASLGELIPINIPDANLKAGLNRIIATQLGTTRLDNQDIFQQELEYLTGVIELSSINIANIEGIQYCINISELHMDNNQIADISPLNNTTFSEMQLLSLSGNQISDISGLATVNLPKLTEINLNNNQISSLTGLDSTKLTTLTSLSIDDNQIKDISNLSGFTNLTTLSISSNQISDITPLSSLNSKLQTLNLHKNQVTDVGILSSFTSLNTLNLAENQISDITALANLYSNLQVLFLDKNQINNVVTLSTFNNLNTLGISENQISDITPLVGLSGNLQKLYLHKNQIKDITTLNGFSSLVELTLSNQSISGEEVTTNSNIVAVDNIVKDNNGDKVNPIVSTEYDYDSTTGKVTLKNIVETGNKTYEFSKDISVNGITSTFSGMVTQNVVIDKTLSVSVPISLAFQVATNTDNPKGSFVTANYKIENNSYDNVNVYVSDFKNVSGNLKVVSPDTFSNWDAISTKETMENIAIGVYPMGDFNEQLYTKDNPIWLADSLVETKLGMITGQGQKDPSVELSNEFTFVSKHGNKFSQKDTSGKHQIILKFTF
ncbi:MAG: leucine-rich repeat domain-containing protein [Clostridium sp.]